MKTTIALNALHEGYRDAGMYNVATSTVHDCSE